MSAGSAIMTGLRGSFDFRGRMTRADYLPFLTASALTLSALLAAGARLLSFTTFIWFTCALVALFYIPVTSAGCRRLRDAGENPLLMLNPLKPVAALLLICGLAFLALQTFWGRAYFLILVMFFPAVLLALAAIPALIILAMTGIYVTDTASRLLLPSASPASQPLPKRRAGLGQADTHPPFPQGDE